MIEKRTDWQERLSPRVNAIAPGYMATNNTQQLRADEQRSSEFSTAFPPGAGACRPI